MNVQLIPPPSAWEVILNSSMIAFALGLVSGLFFEFLRNRLRANENVRATYGELLRELWELQGSARAFTHRYQHYNLTDEGQVVLRDKLACMYEKRAVLAGLIQRARVVDRHGGRLAALQELQGDSLGFVHSIGYAYPIGSHVNMTGSARFHCANDKLLSISERLLEAFNSKYTGIYKKRIDREIVR